MDRIIIDYSDLAEKYKDLFDSDEVRREGDRLQRHVNELANTIQRIQAPNMRVSMWKTVDSTPCYVMDEP